MNEYFASTLASVLEETATNMGNAMVLDRLSANGTVTLEEAEFFHNLCTDVITETAEDFIPSEVNLPDAPAAPEPTASIELFDAVGNKYLFQDGQLIPVDSEEEEMGEMEPSGEMTPSGEMAPMAESEEAPADAVVVEEGTVVEGAPIEEGEVVEEESEILEESSSVVARILANLK